MFRICVVLFLITLSAFSSASIVKSNSQSTVQLQFRNCTVTLASLDYDSLLVDTGTTISQKAESVRYPGGLAGLTRVLKDSMRKLQSSDTTKTTESTNTLTVRLIPESRVIKATLPENWESSAGTSDLSAALGDVTSVLPKMYRIGRLPSGDSWQVLAPIDRRTSAPLSQSP